MEGPPKNRTSGLINTLKSLNKMKLKTPLILKPIFLILAISTIGMLSCVEEYWPELVGNYENFLVVDGKITNEAGPYTVKLSNSSSLSDPKYNPLSGAFVTISDNEGNSETLSEISPGTYQTSETGIQGVIGRMYKLGVSTGDKTYETAYEELLAPVGIESINYKEETHKVSETEEIYESGYQFYISSEKATNNETYFYWEVEETYEHHASYPIEFMYSGSQEVLSDKYLYFYCWTTEIVHEIYTKSTKDLIEAKINELSLHFISAENEKTRLGYSVAAKQYCISEKAYVFHKSLGDMNSNNEGLYSSQPYQIRGNLVNIDNPQETALGYFLTAAVSASEHIFTPKKFFLPEELDEWSKAHCHIRSGGYPNLPSNYHYMISSTPDQWPLYFAEAWIMHVSKDRTWYTLELVGVEDICADCRVSGGTTQKPDFWVD